jgi:hypothetical protein
MEISTSITAGKKDGYELASESGLHYVRLGCPFGVDNGGKAKVGEEGASGDDEKG